MSNLFPEANTRTHTHTLLPQASIHYLFYSNSGATHPALPLASRLHQQAQPPRSLVDFMQPPDKYVMNRLAGRLTDCHRLLDRTFPADLKQVYRQPGSEAHGRFWRFCCACPFVPPAGLKTLPSFGLPSTKIPVYSEKCLLTQLDEALSFILTAFLSCTASLLTQMTSSCVTTWGDKEQP